MMTDIKLERLRQNDPRMTNLDLCLSEDVKMEELTQILQQNRTLQSVSMQYALPTNRTSITSRPYHSEKQQPDETGTTSNSHQMFLELVQALGSIPSLRKIAITGSISYSVPLEVLSTLLRAARHVTKLSIGGTVVARTTDKYSQLAASLHQHTCLEDVNIYGNLLFGGTHNIHNSQETLLSALAILPTLKSVTLIGIAHVFGSSSLLSSTLSLDSVTLLCQSRSLTSLNIYDFALADDHLCAMEQALSKTDNGRVQQQPQPQLKEIRLSSCYLGNRGVEALSNIIALSSNNLQILHVWIQELTPVDASTWDESTRTLLRLAAALQASGTIRDFRLQTGAARQRQILSMADYRHPISSHSVQSALLHMLQTNPRLEACSILCCPPSCQQETAFFLKLNRLGRGRLFDGPAMHVMGPNNKSLQRRSQRRKARTEDWVEVLINARHDLSSSYYFLSMNPSLCQVV